MIQRNFHWLHSWTRWSKPEVVKYVRPLSTVVAYGVASYSAEGFEVTREEQRRECLICGAQEVREVKVKR